MIDKQTLYELVSQKNELVFKVIYSGLPTIKDISDIVFDSKKNELFISSTLQGLIHLKTKEFQILKSNFGFQFENNVRAIMPFMEKSILSVRGPVIFGEKRNIKLNYPTTDYSIGKDKDGNIYMSIFNPKSMNTTLCRFDPKLEHMRRLDTPLVVGITNFQNTKDGNFFVSDFRKIYKVKESHLQPILSLKLSDDAIFSFLIDDNGDTLVGTLHYLFRYSARKRTRDTLLINSSVRTMFNDGMGNVWIGTYGTGYYIINSKKKIQKIPIDKDGALKYIHSFVPDKNGYMWSSSNNGLFRYRVNSVYKYLVDSSTNVDYIRYDYSDGFGSNEFNGGVSPCAIRTKDGSVLMSSVNGIVKFIPEHISLHGNSFGIFIDEVSADGKPYNAENTLLFPKRTANIIIQIASSRIGSEKNDIKSYQIPEISEEWIPVEPSGIITLSGLDHGLYHIIIRKRGGGEYITKTLSFEIKPEIYQTLWFRLMVLLILGITIFGYYKYRISRLQNLQKKLELVVKQRTENLSSTVNALSSTVEALTISRKELEESYNTIQKVTEIVLHDLRSPLRYLSTLSSHISKNRKDFTLDEIDSNLMILNNTCARISFFTNDILNWLMNNNGEIKSKKDNINISALLVDLANIYTSMAKERRNELIVSVEDNIYGICNADILAIIIRNVIDNSIKYTKNGKIILSGQKVQNFIQVSVKDTGIGFDTKSLFQNERFVKSSKTKTLGLKIIDELAYKITLKYSYISQIGEGTLFKIHIPTNEEQR
jgi:signal transduction histidine kinase